MDFQLELVHIFVLQLAHMLIAIGHMLIQRYETKEGDDDGDSA